MEKLLVLYDQDCGLCRAITSSLLSADRAQRLEAHPIQSALGQRLLAALPEAERLASAHAVNSQGEVFSGGAAMAEICARLPGGWPLARLLGLLSGPRDSAYRLVADNRTHISRLVPMRYKGPVRPR